MLIGNGQLYNKIPLTLLGDRWGSFVRDERIHSMDTSDGFTKLNAIPNGYYAPHAIMMPRSAGRISSNFKINGSGGVSSGTMQSGYNISAPNVSGTGGIDQAQTFIGLIVSILASISGSGGVSSATTKALATMLATITGSGGITATAKGLADLVASLTGSGDLDANNTALMDIAAEIRGYGEMTPEGISDAVWKYMIGSSEAQALLAAAGAAGDPLLGSVEGALTLRDVQRIMLAALAGTSERVGNSITFTSPVDNVTVRISGSFDADNNRTGVVIDGD